MQQKPENFNQRATHFVLGSTNQDGSSIYKHDFTKKQSNQDIDYQMVDPFKGNNINPVGKSSYGTTNNALYKDWGKVERAGLDEKKLHDLRSHHFNLGNYGGDQNSTTHKLYYDKKELTSDATKNREQSKNRMQSHSHNLKEQPYTNFKSMYNKDFNEKQGNYNGHVKPDSSRNAIVFGNNMLPMVTTNKTDFTKKQCESNKCGNTFQQSSSLILGDKSQSMQTMNQMYYDEKPIQKNQLPESTMNELRNTHFNLGGMNAGYATQNTQNYHKPPSSLMNQKSQMPEYEAGTWNQKNAKFQAGTTNKRDLPPREVQPYTKAQPRVKGGFQFGYQGNSYTTEFAQNFDSKPKVYEGRAPKPSDSVATGYGGTSYLTEHKASFKERNPADGKIPIDIATKCKVDHFQIGGSGQNAMLTVYQDEFRSDQNKKSKMFHKDNL